MKNIELIKRREGFCKRLEEGSFALLFSGKAPFKSKDQNYPFVINKNFYYLTGLKRENFILLLMTSGADYYEFLFIEEPSDYATKWLGSRLTKEACSDISGLSVENIHYLKDFDAFVSNRILLDSRHALAGIPRQLYLDLFRQETMEKPVSLTKFSQVIQAYPELAIRDLCPVIDDMRRIKSVQEVNEIKQAIDYTNQGIRAMMTHIKPGINEREMEALFEYSIKLAGSPGTSFSTIAASGKNATVLHYEENNCQIEDGMLLLTDLGALSDQYAADITRTYPANGHFTKRQKEIYELVLSVNKAIISRVKPGIYLSDLNSTANDLLAEGLIKLGKIKDASELGKYYYHSIGHYLGLDVHDVGSYKQKLEPGVVITVEPGLYLGDEGIGVRIEDNVLVTNDGYQNLSEAIIKEVDDIEALMQKDR